MTVKKIEIGDVFPTNEGGSVTVIEYINAYEVIVEFNDRMKHRTSKRASHIRSGLIRNPYKPSVYGVGYLGVGSARASENKVRTHGYDIWKAMIGRCYDKKMQKKAPCYVGVTVCEEWHNFQNYYAWLVSQSDYGKGYHLDKDLLFQGNKIYSPDTCVLIPSEINTAVTFSETRNPNLPIGVTFDSAKNKYYACINIDGKTQSLGLYESISDARSAYVDKKESIVKGLAEKWKNKIDKRAYEALISWKAP